MKPKTKIKIEGRSSRGKAYIKKYGEWWDVVNKAKSILEWGITKPMLYISPSRIIKGQNGIGNHWIFNRNDPDYAILEYNE